MITPKEMLALEEQSGNSVETLMGTAGRKVSEVVLEKYSPKDKGVLIICNHGNNGGDGFACALDIADKGIEVDILFVGEEEYLKEASKYYYDKVVNDVTIQFVNYDTDFSEYDVIIDAVLGTGTRGTLKDPIASAIKQINQSTVPIVSIDIPTGINPETGEKSEVVIDPDLVVALHDIKTGAVDYKDKTVIVDIGLIPPSE